MPFPLAHPAAVLPFQRYFPRLVCFPALVAGSVVPDAGYLGARFHFDTLAHSLPGLFTFCLPVGVGSVLLFYLLRARLHRLLPAWIGRITAPLCHSPAPSLLVIVASVFVGIATHLLWDSFTHRDGWLTRQSPLLQHTLMLVDGRQVRVCHVCWYASTLTGVACLASAYQQWRGQSHGPAETVTRRRRRAYAWILGLVVVPVGVLHHLIPGLLGGGLVAVGSIGAILGFAWWVERGLTRAA